MTYYLIRHGQDTSYKRGGWSEESLTEEGTMQIHLLGRQLKKIHADRLISSDLVRAAETSEILLNYIDINIVEYEKDLREVNNGQLAGMDNDLAERLFPGLYWSTLRWEEKYLGGESPKEFQQRIINCWEKLKKQTAGEVIIVTHQGVIDVIMCYEKRIKYTNKNVQFEVKPGSVILLN